MATDSAGSPPAALQHQIALLNEYSTSSELGVLLCSTLFGVFAVQLYLYTHHASKRSPGDSLGLQLFVGWVCIVETAHTVLLWFYFVQTGRRSRFDPAKQLELSPALVFVYFTSALMGATVQSYYAYRLYRFSASLPLAALPILGSLARLGLAAAGVVATLRRPGAPTVLDFMQRFSWCMKGVFSASVAVDVWNTAALCAILARRRSGQIETTARVIDRLIMWSVETGFVTSVLAVLMLAFTLLKRYSVIPGLIHVYLNMFSLSLLITLNARDGMRKTLYSTDARWTIATGSGSQTATHAQTFSFATKDKKQRTSHPKDRERLDSLKLVGPARCEPDAPSLNIRQQTRPISASPMRFEKMPHPHDYGEEEEEEEEEWERGGYARGV